MRIIWTLFLMIGALMAKHTSGLQEITINTISIPVIYEQSGIIPIGHIQLVFQGGGTLNSSQNLGLSALRNQLLNEGTKTLGSVEFAKALEQKAISLYVSGGNETLSFQLDYLKEEESRAIQMLGDLLTDPNLTTQALQKSKTAIISQILNNQDDFDYLADELLDSKLFALTPLAYPKLGTPEQIQSYTLDDIKNSINQALQLKRLIIVVGGDIDVSSTLKKLSKILEQLPNGTQYDRLHFTINPTPSTMIKHAPTKQAYIYFGSPLIVNDLAKESYLAKVASFILGSSGFGSRLMEEVRVKRGLAYSAYISFTTRPLVSYASGYLQTKLESQDEAIKVVKEVIADFVKNGVTQKELDAAKSFLLGSEPLRNETLSQRLGAKFIFYYNGLPLDFNATQLQQIQNLDLATLNAYIKQHTEINNLTFAIITAEAKSAKSKQDSSQSLAKTAKTPTKSSQKPKKEQK
ncbi:putative Processing Protease [Helicobacter fennelliae MRY12-0050]|nr:putative Processing Protease [Helicobacter fennelliae MRY12-0050]